jgi:ankyrin repeat protein
MDKNGFPKISLGSDTTKSLQPVTSAPTEHSKEPIQKKEATVDLGAKLVELAKAGNTSGVIALLNQGALVNYQNENGLSSLMAAAQSSSTLTMKALIDRGADANLLDTRGHTALSYAVRWGDLSGVVLLRTTNINIDTRSADGFLAEDYAKARGDKDVISFLAAWRSELKAMQPKKKSGKRKD